MTQKLSAEQRGVLLLVGRSVARDDGWEKKSKKGKGIFWGSDALSLAPPSEPS